MDRRRVLVLGSLALAALLAFPVSTVSAASTHLRVCGALTTASPFFDVFIGDDRWFLRAADDGPIAGIRLRINQLDITRANDGDRVRVRVFVFCNGSVRFVRGGVARGPAEAELAFAGRPVQTRRGLAVVANAADLRIVVHGQDGNDTIQVGTVNGIIAILIG
jgi:hypothetical protein